MCPSSSYECAMPERHTPRSGYCDRARRLSVLSVRRAGLNPAVSVDPIRRRSAVPLTQTQLVNAIAERAELIQGRGQAGARRARRGACSRSSGTPRRSGSAGWFSSRRGSSPPRRSARAATRRPARRSHRRQAGQRRPARPPAGQGQGSTALGAEGASPTRRLSPAHRHCLCADRAGTRRSGADQPS